MVIIEPLESSAGADMMRHTCTAQLTCHRTTSNSAGCRLTCLAAGQAGMGAAELSFVRRGGSSTQPPSHAFSASPLGLCTLDSFGEDPCPRQRTSLALFRQSLPHLLILPT